MTKNERQAVRAQKKPARSVKEKRQAKKMKQDAQAATRKEWSQK
jgi:hypothetical protein